MLIDFHTHTDASDGALSPAELLGRARERGVALLAVTDHDTVAAGRALAAAARLSGEPGAGGGPRLVPGVELSCRWAGTTVHILGLGIDCDHPVLTAGLVQLEAARAARAEVIARRLEQRGFPDALPGALEEAGRSQLGRPHFAAWMLRQGHVASFDEAFDRYLGAGKPGDVKAFWPELAEVTAWIVASGGTAVVAHPLKYRFTGMKLRRMLDEFTAAGGRGIEIVSGRQSADQVQHLRRLAREYNLLASVGSDFHQDTAYGPDLGVELAPFERLPGVWEQWITPA